MGFKNCVKVILYFFSPVDVKYREKSWSNDSVNFILHVQPRTHQLILVDRSCLVSLDHGRSQAGARDVPLEMWESDSCAAGVVC